MTHASGLCGQPDDPYGKTCIHKISADTLKLRPLELRGSCAASGVRAGPYGCGPTRIQQPARSLLYTILTLILLCNRPPVLVVTLAVGQLTKAGATRRGQV
jgi:hypothetical protein